MTPDAAPEIAGWSDAHLRATIQANPGVGADAGLPDPIRFLTTVTRVIRTRWREAEPDPARPPAVFLLDPDLPDSLRPEDVVTRPMLDNGLTELEGNVWFVTAAASRGRGLALDAEIDDADLFDLVDDLGRGEVPAIVYDARTRKPQARFYAAGLRSESYEPVRLHSEAIALDDIFAVIDRVHEQTLVTPSSQSRDVKLWVKGRELWASEKAEGLIQASIRTGLVGAFPSCIVRAEQVQATGRLDLEIEEVADDDPSYITRHALLELKVLRARGSTGAPVTAARNDEAIESGVLQAVAYRKERGHRAAALCCFDMREDHTGESCFEQVAERARRKKIGLRVWHLFGTASAYRRHVA